MTDYLDSFRKCFKQVAELHRCELAYFEQLYDSSVHKLFIDLTPKLRLTDPLADEASFGTYRKTIRDGYIPEFFLDKNLVEEETLDEVSRVLRNHAPDQNRWKDINFRFNTCHIQDFTFNSVTLLDALSAAKSPNKLGMERTEVGELRLSDTICKEMQNPREVVIRLTYMFYVAVLGYTPKFYQQHKSVALVTLADDAVALELAGFCKKKYNYDGTILFSKKMDKLFKDELVYKQAKQEIRDFITNRDALKTQAKQNPDSPDAKSYFEMRDIVDGIGAAIQFFRVCVTAFFVDVADGKEVKSAFEKLMAMMAFIVSLDLAARIK